MLVGEPQEVVSKLERQYEACGGFGHLAGSFHHGNVLHEKTMQSLELFADEVLPEIKKIGP